MSDLPVQRKLIDSRVGPVTGAHIVDLAGKSVLAQMAVLKSITTPRREGKAKTREQARIPSRKS